jgi:trimethylamine--corrinoid protein Co-methyltransferase
MMTTDRPPIQPIQTRYKLQLLSDEELDHMQDATLKILEKVGVLFPSKQALSIFADAGAEVDFKTQIVRLAPELVFEALSHVPRYFNLGARDPACNLTLQPGTSYFTNDGCGVETVELESGNRRPSRKDDVAMMAHISDYLSSIAFVWPMVSAQDYGETAPLHELDAAWNHTVKHVQSETIMGARLARRALEMGLVMAGDRETLRAHPPFSLLVCTIAPLTQDKDGIEGALVLAAAGIPVGFMAMPTLGTTAPATLAGAFAMADAESVSAAVLMQLASPGAPVFHSLLQAYADPRSGAYVGYPLNVRTRYASIELAHHWGIPTLGGAFGTDSRTPGTWQAAAEVALDPLLVSLAGSELVTGIGLNQTYTVLYPEAIILDDDLYHRARHALQGLDISEETLALDTIQSVGPGGHFLAQKHTRKHMRDSMQPAVTHQMDPQGGYRDALQVARERARWILDNYEPEPLEKAKQTELTRILEAAGKEFS